MRAADVAGLVLDPDPGCRRPAGRFRQSGDRRERGDAESLAVGPRDGRVQRLDQGAEIGVREAVGEGEVVGQGQASVAQERGLGREIVRRFRESRFTVQMADQDVVDAVALRRARTGEGQGCRRVDDRAAARTNDPDAVHAHSLLAASERALNSSIIASQAGTRSRSPSQKD